MNEKAAVPGFKVLTSDYALKMLTGELKPKPSRGIRRLWRRFRLWLDWDVLSPIADWQISRRLKIDGWLATWAIDIGDIDGHVAAAVEYARRPDAKFYTLEELKRALEDDAHDE